MDDYSLVSLSDSKNEWCARLVNTLTPCIIVGLNSIFKESWDLCIENDEEDKYLMTFQTFLSRIPKWNSDIIETERKRIEESSNCNYLEELITCVHVIQLKALTCARVGNKQKKVDIDIPSVNTFIHKVYCNVARKLYTSIYLFEKDLLPLEIQKHNRELELIIKECILNTVRDTMPVETILQAYMDETEELDVNEEVVVINEKKPVSNANEDVVTQSSSVNVSNTSPSVNLESVNMVEIKKDETPSISKSTSEDKPVTVTAVDEGVKSTLETSSKVDLTPTTSSIVPVLQDSVTNTVPAITAAPDVVATPVMTVAPEVAAVPAITAAAPVIDVIEQKDTVNFNDIDNRVDINGKTDTVLAPKTDERLEKIAEISAERRRQEEEEEEDEKIKIGESVSLDIVDVNDLNKPVTINDSPILDDIEVLS